MSALRLQRVLGLGSYQTAWTMLHRLRRAMVRPGREQPMRQWVLSFPFQLRVLFASRPAILGQVLGIVYRVIAKHLVKKAGLTRKTARTGANHADPALWQRAEPQHPLSHAVSRRGLCRRPRRRRRSACR